jgi:succinate dehydrogenase / fumarate reductase cytochrome b subunit
LAASVPAAVYLFGLSIRDEQGFVRVTELFAQRAFKTLEVIVVWALAHHLLAGVRHMLTDLGVGSPLRVARGSGWLVNLAGVVLALLAARTMW